jgi:hypothetical protein
VLWIRIGFNTDPDSAFYINADPEDPDPDPDQIYESQKVEFLHERIR